MAEVLKRGTSIKFKRFTSSDYEITSKNVTIYNREIDRSRKQEHSINSAFRSVQRSHNKVYEILRSNTWQYFITLTFGSEDRSDDQYCRDQFTKWQHNIRRQFPNLYYIAVPEYHKKGSIHYHLVIGGTNARELGLKKTNLVYHKGKSWKRKDFIKAGFEFKPEIGEGVPIYNLSGWKQGFSTATEVRSSDAVAIYVSKYLTKSHVDPRFFNKRRFYTSHNIHLPEVFSHFEDSEFHLEDGELPLRFIMDLQPEQYGTVIYQNYDNHYSQIKPNSEMVSFIDTLFSR